MVVIDLYSKRQKRLNGEQSNIYIYDEIPKKLREQIRQIARDFFYPSREEYAKMVAYLRGEYGDEKLANGAVCEGLNEYYSYEKELFDFFKIKDDCEQCLDIIELIFKFISDSYKSNKEKSISELNIRFKENGVGYRFENNQIIRIDNELLH